MSPKTQTAPKNEPDHETRFHAIMELATRTAPGPDGKLSPEAVRAINLIAGIPEEGQLSLDGQNKETIKSDSTLLIADGPADSEECFSSEPPGSGWIFCGAGRWVRGRRRTDATDV